METEGLLVCGKCRDFLKMHDLIMNKICRTSAKTEVYHVFWLFLGEVFADGNTQSFAMSWTFWEAYFFRISPPFGMMLDPIYYHPYVLRW